MFSWLQTLRRTELALVLTGAALALAWWGVLGSSRQRPALPTAEVVDYGNFQPDRRFPEKPPRLGAPVVAPSDSDVAGDELVLGVEIGLVSRAYPLNMLSGPDHECLNDELAGEAIAVTWCDFCHDGIVYSRDLDGQRLTLVVSGFLWEYSMVLIDAETRSLWTQVAGRSLQGPLAGKSLTRLPATVTTWASWKALHPTTDVINLPRERDLFRRDYQHQRARFVVGFEHQGAAAHARFDRLAGRRVVNFEVAEFPLVTTYDDDATAARVFQRVVRDRVLSFTPAARGTMFDRETNSTWNASTGLCTAGPLVGSRLAQQPAIVAYTQVWKAFFPQSRDFST
ncbi:MAG: DUF3179 domain-containing (seleno)protein [Planctomycetaceae bacterium]